MSGLPQYTAAVHCTAWCINPQVINRGQIWPFAYFFKKHLSCKLVISSFLDFRDADRQSNAKSYAMGHGSVETDGRGDVLFKTAI